MYKTGIQVEFNQSRNQGDEGQYEPLDNKYKSGTRGYIIHHNEDADTYTVRQGLVDITDVPADHLFNPNSELATRVEERLRKKQETKTFKDTENRVGGSKKEKMAYKIVQSSNLDEIEQDENLAIELVKKDKVYPKVDLSKQREEGIGAGAAFLKAKLRESYGAAPPNNAPARKMYVAFAEMLVKQFEPVVNVKQFEETADKVVNGGILFFIHVLMGGGDAAKTDAIAERMKQETAGRDSLIDSLKAERERLQKEYDEEILYVKKTLPEFWNEEKTAYNMDAVPVEAKRVMQQITNLRWEAWEKLTQEQSANSFSTIEIEFLKGFGVKTNQSKRYVTYQLFRDIFGDRFVNFISKGSLPAVATYELARSYEALSVPESIQLIEKEGSYYSEHLLKAEAQLVEVKTLMGREQHDEFFTGRNGDLSFKGGNFYQYGNGYFGYKDCKTVPLIEAYKERWITNTLKNNIALAEKLAAIKEKYKARENNWDWAFGAKPTGDGPRKTSTEIRINTYPPLDFIKRIGGLKITDADITFESILDKFGFKSVQSGLSLKDTEAKEHVRHFLGAMADLGDILNMDIVTLNKIGKLSIAFAARGSGKASAHYEALHKIINITKTRGGGALAHEYMHYLDNILPSFDNETPDYKSWASEIESPKKNYSYKYKSVKNEAVFKAVQDIFIFIYTRKTPYFIGPDGTRIRQDGNPNSNTRLPSTEPIIVKKTIHASEGTRTFGIPQWPNITDINEYWKDFQYQYSQYRLFENIKRRDIEIIGFIVKKFGLKEHEFTFETKKSAYYANSQAMSSDYWTRPWELFARAFETFIWDKLDKAGRANNYLVAGAYFDGFGGVYPAGDERAELFLLYNDLMQTIKTEYNIPDFKPWTTERVDEYVAIDANEKETAEPIVEPVTAKSAPSPLERAGVRPKRKPAKSAPSPSGRDGVGLQLSYNNLAKEAHEKSRIETETINREFEEHSQRGTESWPPEEIMEAQITDKMKFGTELTAAELEFANENFYRARGFSFDQMGKMVADDQQAGTPSPLERDGVRPERITVKLREFLSLLKAEKMSRGGLVTNERFENNYIIH